MKHKPFERGCLKFTLKPTILLVRKFYFKLKPGTNKKFIILRVVLVQDHTVSIFFL